MSSVDLHTHYSYQSMMREAIAIVIAPLRSPKCVYPSPPLLPSLPPLPSSSSSHHRPSSFGIFRLTEPDGMAEIGACSDRVRALSLSLIMTQTNTFSHARAGLSPAFGQRDVVQGVRTHDARVGRAASLALQGH